MSMNKTILQFMSPERTWSLNDGHSERRSRRWRERERADRHSSSDSPVLLVPPRITGLWQYLSGWQAPQEGEKKARQCKVKLQTVTKIPTNYGEDWKNSILRTCTACYWIIYGSLVGGGLSSLCSYKWHFKTGPMFRICDTLVRGFYLLHAKFDKTNGHEMCFQTTARMT